MGDTDKLRPEVQAAMEVIAGEAVCTCHEDYTSRGMKDPACNHDLQEYVDTIRAELLRLADENAQLRDVLADRDMDREMAAHANRELAALKARVKPCAQVVGGEVRALMDPEDEGKYVAVVVVEE